MDKLSAMLLTAFVVGGAVSTSATAQDASRYTRVNDRKACVFKETKASDAGPDSCEFLCDGPVAGVKTRLWSCYDYEHLFVRLDGEWYSTWSAMMAVGGFSGLANKNGVVEWVFQSGAPISRAGLKGLIVRFRGVDRDNHNRNALAVFSLKPGDICWKGNFASNEAARTAVDAGPCREKLAPEKP